MRSFFRARQRLAPACWGPQGLGSGCRRFSRKFGFSFGNVNREGAPVLAGSGSACSGGRFFRRSYPGLKRGTAAFGLGMQTRTARDPFARAWAARSPVPAAVDVLIRISFQYHALSERTQYRPVK